MIELRITSEAEHTPEYLQLSREIQDLDKRVRNRPTNTNELEEAMSRYVDNLAENLPKVYWEEQQYLSRISQHVADKFPDPSLGNRLWDIFSLEQAKQVRGREEMLYSGKVTEDKVKEILKLLRE